MSHCRVCGHPIGPRSENGLYFLNLKEWPPWLDGLCLNCLYDLMSYVEVEDNKELPITEHELNVFLADTMALYARRTAEGKPLFRCEVLVGGRFIHDPEDLPCHRFAREQIDGHWVCSHCHRRHTKGQTLAFLGEAVHRPKPYLIWATSPEELIAEATRLAKG